MAHRMYEVGARTIESSQNVHCIELSNLWVGQAQGVRVEPRLVSQHSIAAGQNTGHALVHLLMFVTVLTIVLQQVGLVFHSLL